MHWSYVFLTLTHECVIIILQVAKCLKDLLDLCHVFCSLLSQGEEAATHRNDKLMENISKVETLQIQPQNILWAIWLFLP